MDSAELAAFDGKVKSAGRLAKKIIHLQTQIDKLTHQKASAAEALSALLKEIQNAAPK